MKYCWTVFGVYNPYNKTGYFILVQRVRIRQFYDFASRKLDPSLCARLRDSFFYVFGGGGRKCHFSWPCGDRAGADPLFGVRNVLDE